MQRLSLARGYLQLESPLTTADNFIYLLYAEGYEDDIS